MGQGKFGLAAVAYVVLFGACAVLDDLAPAFLLTAAVSLVFLLAGIAFLPRIRPAIKVAIASAGEGDSDAIPIRIAETEIPMRPYVQIATCTLTLRHIPELVASGLLAIGTIAVVASGAASYRTLLVNWGLFALEGACIAGAVILLMCLRWANECWLLRRAHAVLAPITGMESGLAYRQARYEFSDSAGNRFGGYSRIFGESAENAVVVFYEPTNPDENRAHCSLNFRRLRIHAVGAPRLGKESTTESTSS